MSVSPDADGVIRLTCGGVDMELLVVAPNAGSGLQPKPPIKANSPPRGPVRPKPPAWPKEDPLDRPVFRFGLGPVSPVAWPGLDQVLDSGTQFLLADYDLRKLQGLDGIVKATAEQAQSPDLLHLKANIIDLHAVQDMSAGLGKAFGSDAPKLFFDLKSGRTRTLG